MEQQRGVKLLPQRTILLTKPPLSITIPFQIQFHNSKRLYGIVNQRYQKFTNLLKTFWRTFIRRVR